jgi:hypothetical protein
MTAPAGSSCVTPAVGATGTAKCSLGSLLAGNSLKLTIVVLVVAPKGQSIANTVQATGTAFDPDLLDNQATVVTSVQ